MIQKIVAAAIAAALMFGALAPVEPAHNVFATGGFGHTAALNEQLMEELFED